MDPSTLSVLGLALLVGANRFLVSVLHRGRVPLAFWPVQAMDLAAVGWLGFAGMPGFEGRWRVVDAFVALLLLIHVVENLHLRSLARRRRGNMAALEQEARLHDEVRVALSDEDKKRP